MKLQYSVRGQLLPGNLAFLLLPAFPLNLHQWDNVCQGLGDIPAVRLSHPGFEYSVENTPSIDAYADAALSVCDELEIGRIIVVGNSLGGYVAQNIYLRYPQRVAGIALLGTNGREDSDQARSQRLEKALEASLNLLSLEGVRQSASGLLGSASVDLADTVYRQTEGLTNDSLAWCQRAMAHRGRTIEKLSLASSVPALVMHGEEDQASCLDDAKELAQALGVEPIFWPGRGHLLPTEIPDYVAKYLRRLYSLAN
ncbi:alpha/beta hydrolase [Actinomycetaceae bacterium TAE3-ERU4]|nr:alpha/beta hydrolase [Actinomycetaceae bacterium TAE3-ERU4]